MDDEQQLNLFDTYGLDSIEPLPELDVRQVKKLLTATLLNKSAKLSDIQRGAQIYYSIIKSERELDRDKDDIKPMSININIRGEEEND